jgi:predicted transcriptional regulator
LTAADIQKLLNAKILACEEKIDMEITSAFASDMMSDCLAFAKDVSVLITGLCNPQVMRTAELLDIECIIFIKGKEPTDSMIELAKNNGICVLLSEYCLFETCGILFKTGELRGASRGC